MSDDPVALIRKLCKNVHQDGNDLVADCPVCTEKGGLHYSATRQMWWCSGCHELAGVAALAIYLGQAPPPGAVQESTVQRRLRTNSRPYLDPKRTVLSPGEHFPDGTMIEMVYQGGDSRYLVARPGSDLKHIDMVHFYVGPDGVTYAPPDYFRASPAIGKIVFPATNIQEYGSDEALWNRVAAYLHKWFDLKPMWERVITNYIMMTYIFEAFGTVPYLRIMDHRFGQGKTRLGRVASLACLRPIWLSGASEPSIFFRTVDRWRGTIFIDEVDMNPSTEIYSLLTKILNTSNEPLGGIGHITRNTEPRRTYTWEPIYYSAFGPKIVTQRKPFQDMALESRFVTVDMKRRERQDVSVVANWPAILADAEQLRNQLTYWRLVKMTSGVSVGELKSIRRCCDRTQQIFAPLISVPQNPKAKMATIIAARQHNRQYSQPPLTPSGIDVAVTLVKISGGSKSVALNGTVIVQLAGLMRESGADEKRCVRAIRDLGFDLAKRKRMPDRALLLSRWMIQRIERRLANDYGIVVDVGRGGVHNDGPADPSIVRRTEPKCTRRNSRRKVPFRLQVEGETWNEYPRENRRYYRGDSDPSGGGNGGGIEGGDGLGNGGLRSGVHGGGGGGEPGCVPQPRRKRGRPPKRH